MEEALRRYLVRKRLGEPVLEGGREGIEPDIPDIFDGKDGLIRDTELAAPLGFSDAQSVSRFVASTAKTMGFNKGFQEDRSCRQACTTSVLGRISPRQYH